MVLSRNAIPWSLVGFPAVSIPCGRSSAGLPMGIQLVAAPGADALLVAAGRVVEEVGRGPDRGNRRRGTTPVHFASVARGGGPNRVRRAALRWMDSWVDPLLFFLAATSIPMLIVQTGDPSETDRSLIVVVSWVIWGASPRTSSPAS